MKGLILLDWDNTIVDYNGQINDSRLKEVIQAKIHQGWVVGLNSDTPLRRLQGWRRSLGLNGPIVAERGAVIWWTDGPEVILSQTQGIFSTFRQEILLKLAQMEGYALFLGDSTQFISSVAHFISNDKAVIAMDAYRVCSFGMFVRRICDGVLVRDLSTTSAMYTWLQSVAPFQAQVAPVDFNEENCFLSISALDTNKSTGVHGLIENWQAPPEVIMVGDSMADHIDLPGVQIWAVGNAHLDFKQKADKVATREYAQGCVQLLSTL